MPFAIDNNELPRFYRSIDFSTKKNMLIYIAKI